MSTQGHSKALTTWEKWYVVHLVMIGGLQTTLKASKDVKHEIEDVCVQIVRNTLIGVREAAIGKVSKLALFPKNVKEKLVFAKAHKD